LARLPITLKANVQFSMIMCVGTYHPTAYLYPIARACGRSHQDIGVEGAIAVLMNLLHHLEVMMWRMRCGGNGILE